MVSPSPLQGSIWLVFNPNMTAYRGGCRFTHLKPFLPLNCVHIQLFRLTHRRFSSFTKLAHKKGL